MTLLSRSAITLAALALCACSDATAAYYGGPHVGGYGATPGGAQDIGYARMLVAGGTVPPADAITAEGLLGEHDIPVDGAACTDLLCARPSMAVAPSLETGHDETWMVLGMSSGIVDFHRPPIDVALVLDASSAMSIDMQEVIEASSTLVRALNADDRVSVVVFRDAAETIVPMTVRGSDPSALIATLQRIEVSGGSTGFLRGLDAGYAQVRSVGDDPTRLRRVVAFSCGYVSSTLDQLTTLVADAGDERIGLTFVGVLLSWDATLANILTTHRGGNSFYTGSLDEVQHVFDTDLDETLTPLAYDVHLDLALAPGWHVARTYGIPGDETGTPSPSIDVSTAFLSHDHGAIVVRLARDAGANDAVGDTTLSYVPESALGWTDAVDATTSVTAPAADAVTYGGNGVRIAVALVNEADRLRAASTAYAAGDRAGARTIVDALLAYLRPEADATADAGLAREVDFVTSYRALL